MIILILETFDTRALEAQKNLYACPFFCAFKYGAVGLRYFMLVEVQGETEVEACH